MTPWGNTIEQQHHGWWWSWVAMPWMIPGWCHHDCDDEWCHDRQKATGCTTYTECMMAHYYYYYDHRLRRQAAHGKCMGLLLPSADRLWRQAHCSSVSMVSSLTHDVCGILSLSVKKWRVRDSSDGLWRVVTGSFSSQIFFLKFRKFTYRTLRNP